MLVSLGFFEWNLSGHFKYWFLRSCTLSIRCKLKITCDNLRFLNWKTMKRFPCRNTRIRSDPKCVLKLRRKFKAPTSFQGLASSQATWLIYKTLIPKSQMIQRLAKYFPNFELLFFSVKSCVTCCLVSMLWKQVLFRILKICSLIQNLFILFPCLCWQMHLETEPTEIEPQLIKAQLVRHFKTSSLRLTSRSSANAEVADDLREIGKT